MERTKMKLPVAVLAISSTVFLLDPSSAFAQQAGSSGATTNSASRPTPPVPPFSPPPQSNHKSYRTSHSSAASGHKTRMHAGRTRRRRIHYWSHQPLRPIGDETAGVGHAATGLNAHVA